jgi:repressor LexA
MKGTDIGFQLKVLREKHSMTQAQLADKLDVSKQTVSNWEVGRKIPRMGYIEKLSQIFNVPKSQIIDGIPGITSSIPTNMDHHYRTNTVIVSIPLLGEIACGEPITAEENVEDHIAHIYPAGQVPEGNLFDLRAKGESMDPTIPNGAIVTVREQPEVEDGQIAAVLVNGNTEATLKRVKHINGMVVLQPDNDTFDPIILTQDHPGRIIGRAIEVRSKL